MAGAADTTPNTPFYKLGGHETFQAICNRFYDLMGGMHGDNAPDSAWLDSMFRSQLVWDTTMAASTVRGRALTGGKAVLLIGQFHSDHEGGTVQQIRAMAPDALSVISKCWPCLTLPIFSQITKVEPMIREMG